MPALNASQSVFTDGSKNLTVKSAAQVRTFLNVADGAIANVVEDTSPQAGGEFDFGAHSAGFTEQTITYVATVVTVDWALGNKAAMTFGAGNVATLLFTNPTKPGNLLLKLRQDGTGSRSITAYDPDVIWGDGGTAPTLTTTASAVDFEAFYFAGDGRYYGVPSANFPFS